MAEPGVRRVEHGLVSQNQRMKSFFTKVGWLVGSTGLNNTMAREIQRHLRHSGDTPIHGKTDFIP